MTHSQPESSSSKSNNSPQWGLVILIMGVLLLASFALGQGDTETTASLLPAETENLLEATPSEVPPVNTDEVPPAEQANLDIPPQPDEIGYTDGIIFFATVLVLILLVSTLREVVQRKGV